jgi:polysaccharide pyruvyl transferase WcaK-like protein
MRAATDYDQQSHRATQQIRSRAIGLFGFLGSGNIGNDASMESVLAYLQQAHPDVVVDAMCSGPQQLREAYGIDGIPIFWYNAHDFSRVRFAAPILKVVGKGIDVARTAAWVRRHDVVVVPGMGVLETDMPISPFGFPFALFLLSAWGRILGTKVALVSVGANVIKQRGTRWLVATAARLASYRSYRDVASQQAMHVMGVNSEADDVSADVAFGLPVPAAGPADPAIVAVGVMDFHGSNDDRDRATEIYAHYLDNMTGFIVWLVAHGRTVRLVVGDGRWDADVVRQIVARVFAQRPDLPHDRIVADPIQNLAQLLAALAPAKSVVAARYHNVIFALKLNKPTIAIAYAHKHEALMSDMGLSRFMQRATSIDLDRLIQQFTELEECSELLRQDISWRNAAKASQVEEQFKKITAML